jgi:hypothetical protein
MESKARLLQDLQSLPSTAPPGETRCLPKTTLDKGAAELRIDDDLFEGSSQSIDVEGVDEEGRVTGNFG